MSPTRPPGASTTSPELWIAFGRLLLVIMLVSAKPISEFVKND
jgi:hypothetical protein